MLENGISTEADDIEHSNDFLQLKVCIHINNAPLFNMSYFGNVFAVICFRCMLH